MLTFLGAKNIVRTSEDDAQQIEGADVLIGFSDTKNFTDSIIKSMAENPIIMTMDDCSDIERVKKAAGECVVITGGKNQSALIFPYMTRAVLETEATQINVEMKVAAAKELVQVRMKKRELNQSYDEYKHMNSITAAIKNAAVDSGVARKR